MPTKQQASTSTGGIVPRGLKPWSPQKIVFHPTTGMMEYAGSLSKQRPAKKTTKKTNKNKTKSTVKDGVTKKAAPKKTSSGKKATKKEKESTSKANVHLHVHLNMVAPKSKNGGSKKVKKA